MSQSRRFALRRQVTDDRDVVFVPTFVGGAMTSVDLRPMLPIVLDQGQIGTCAANATANALQYLLRKERRVEFSPSRLFIYWYVRVLMGVAPTEDSGSDLRTMCQAVRRYHVPDETAWPYLPHPEDRYKLQPSVAAIEAVSDHVKVAYLGVKQDLSHIHDCLSQGYPMVIGINVYDSFESQAVSNTGVVPMPAPADKLVGGHAVLLCGIDVGSRCVIVQNSWGFHWGQKGFFTLPFAYILDPDLTFDLWTYRLFE